MQKINIPTDFIYLFLSDWKPVEPNEQNIADEENGSFPDIFVEFKLLNMYLLSIAHYLEKCLTNLDFVFLISG